MSLIRSISQRFQEFLLSLKWPIWKNLLTIEVVYEIATLAEFSTADFSSDENLALVKPQKNVRSKVSGRERAQDSLLGREDVRPLSHAH